MKRRLAEWAKEAAKDPWRAPWSGQRVSVITRIGGGFLTLCFALVALMVASPYAWGHKALELSFSELAHVVLFGYLIILFGRVAVTGHAPKTWVPWR